jgi:hypothetical protein
MTGNSEVIHIPDKRASPTTETLLLFFWASEEFELETNQRVLAEVIKWQPAQTWFQSATFVPPAA